MGIQPRVRLRLGQGRHVSSVGTMAGEGSALEGRFVFRIGGGCAVSCVGFIVVAMIRHGFLN